MTALSAGADLAMVLMVTGLALLAAGLFVISEDQTSRPYPAGNTLVVVGFLCGFAALMTAPA
ncbi:hypothetical protein ACFULT_22190 [Rhodococcus sp. NPDC057297]|uniref:hypothetical protein n=1 Tax=Rhodococcus sp. NPDC057297 TaxID=3346090 RepID=UPI00362B4F14